MKRGFIFLILILIFFAFFLWQGIHLPKFEREKEILFSIEKGQSVSQIAKNLENQGLIKNKIFFQIYLIFSGKYRKLQAGNYSLNPEMNIPEIAKKIVFGKTLEEKITIIEGWNLRDIGFYFEGKGRFQAEEFFELVGFPLIDYSKTKELPSPKDFSDEFDFLWDKPKNLGLEGYLFPDTYEIRKEKTENRKQEIEEIVRKMLGNFDKKLTLELREEIKKQGKTIFEIIIMASLLEKEVKLKEEKELVSGILWKRLENKIPLQVDATITYITGKKTTKISKDEMEIDSPYNTYKYLGLPLGPICNPGLDSIIASIYPKDSDFWYYFSIPEGQTLFFKTLKEHNLAKLKYLK